ncbi:hypothetical protein V3468_02885 [Flavobacterium oreochromis]|uniref:hypothetical protein n=1 Tax=Flavobacterium oreochromis TaxID=2906078 RepID=UPI00385BBECA
MNKQNFNQSEGFPLETEVLADMQESFDIFNSLGNIAGNFSIISGCEETNGFVSNGVVFINGEVLEFRGGNVSSTVIIVENRIKKEFENGEEKDVLFIRYATFGIGVSTYNWTDFKRPKSTVQLTKDKTEQIEFEKLIERVKQLEARPTANVPVGLVAIWGLPANTIPIGWVEHQPLRGRTPVGKDPSYDTNTNGDLTNYNLNVLDFAGGKREHKLTVSEMPEHDHQQGSEALYNSYGGGGYVGSRTWGAEGNAAYINALTSKKGGDKPHTNMQPYRVVEFIRYTG